MALAININELLNKQKIDCRKIRVSRRWIATNMKHLQDTGVVKRVGPNKGGHWEVIKISE